ncbi:MAG TPA: hypothetical protein VGC79_35935 [Polyangiaceae bacterium]
MNSTPPSPDDLQRELERVRAAQPEAPRPATPSVRQHLTKSALRLVLLWLLLIVVFLGVRYFLA